MKLLPDFQRKFQETPGSNDQIIKVTILFRFLYPGSVPEYGTKIFDSQPASKFPVLQRVTLVFLKTF
jgi:hypothetical protein